MAFSIRRHLAVILVYGLLVIGMTWPVAANLTARVAGSGGDVWQTLWRFDYKWDALQSAITNRQINQFIQEEFLGGGLPRLINLSVWPWMPFHIGFGQPAAYNLVWLLSFVMSGYGMFLLLEQLTFTDQSSNSELVTRHGSNGLVKIAPGFLAGVIYMFLPYHVAHALGHFGAMQLQWLPLIMALSIAWFRQPSWFKACVLAVLVIVQGITEHHYLLWLVLVLIFALFFKRAPVRHRLSQPATRWQLLVTAGVAVVLLGLIYWPTIRLSFQDDSPLNLGRDQLVRFSADMFSVIIPSPFNPILGGVANNFFTKYFTGNIAEVVQFIGWLPLLLILFFYQTIRSKDKRFWVIVAIFFYILSLGPLLHVFGRVINIHLPYELIDSWPIFSSIRTIARAGVMMGLCIAVLAGLVLAAQIKRWQSAVALLLVILVEFSFFPFPMQSASLTRVYESLETAPDGKILEIPAGTNYVTASKALYASRQHGRDTLGNIALERGTDGQEMELVRSLPAIRQLLYLRTTDLRQERVEFFQQNLVETFWDVAKFTDLGAVIVHTDSISPLQLSAIRSYFMRVGLTEKTYDDALYYGVEKGNSNVSDGVFLMRDGGWSGVGYDPERDSIFAEVEEQATITLENTTDHSLDAEVIFTLPDENTGSGQVTREGSQVATISQGASTVNFTTVLNPGSNLFLFKTDNGNKLIIQNPDYYLIDPL